MSNELIKDMIDNIIDDNQAAAQETFTDLLSQKVTDALDARKVQLAQQLGAEDGQV